jgi:sugar/nucleoside kinase (ribokinase family)
VLAALGDLVDDIVVKVTGQIQVATDTDSVITRRRGGSAANVAAVAARLTGRARLLCRVGDDRIGEGLVGEIASEGVDVSVVQRGGRTGSIVVLVDEFGERTFLTDRGASPLLDSPDPAWLDGVSVLHVPLYSLAGGPIEVTATTLIGWAHDWDIPVSIDLSSVAVIHALGLAGVRQRLARLDPHVVFANGDEAAAFHIEEPIGRAITIVKRGAAGAEVLADAGRAVVPAFAIPGIPDTTGAGDAFAAGVLTSPDLFGDPVAACRSGHAAAAEVLLTRSGMQ